MADPSVVDAPNEGDNDADSSQVLDAQVQGEVQGHLGARQPSDVVGEAGVTAGPLEPSVVDALNTLREELRDYGLDILGRPSEEAVAALSVVETALAAETNAHRTEKEWRKELWHKWESAEARAVAAEAERDTYRAALERLRDWPAAASQYAADDMRAIARAVLAGEEPT